MKLIIINALLLLNFSNLYSTGYEKNKWIEYKPQKKSTKTKTRVKWNEELTGLYQEAKSSLDKEKQTASEILKKMKIINKELAEDLHRDHIASHLQKDKKKAPIAKDVLQKMKIGYLLN